MLRKYSPNLWYLSVIFLLATTANKVRFATTLTIYQAWELGDFTNKEER